MYLFFHLHPHVIIIIIIIIILTRKSILEICELMQIATRLNRDSYVNRFPLLCSVLIL